VFVAFLLPFLDIGIVQNPMLRAEPTTWSKLLPGYGGVRVVLDGAFTQSFDELVPLLIGLGWLLAVTVAVVLTYRHATRPATACHAHSRSSQHALGNGSAQGFPH
jgi:hypothetical protein